MKGADVKGAPFRLAEVFARMAWAHLEGRPVDSGDMLASVVLGAVVGLSLVTPTGHVTRRRRRLRRLRRLRVVRLNKPEGP